MRNRKTSSQFIIFATALVLVVVVAACEPVDVFSDYRGVDLLGERSIGIASWTVAYQGGATPTNDYIDYVTLTPAEYGTDTGLPSGSVVYRLEIPNLLPDGDFEGSTVGNAPTGWTVDAPAGVFEVDTGASAGMPDGNYVKLQFAADDNAYFNLSTLTDSFVVGGLYHFQVDIKRVDDEAAILFDYGNASTSHLGRDDWRIDPVSGQAIVVESVPNRRMENLDKNTLFAAQATSDRFFAGGPRADNPFQDGFFDNLRIGRHDVFPQVRLELPLSATGDQHEFVPGRYVFSVFVKSEVDAQVTPSTSNRFRSNQLSIGIDEIYQAYDRVDYGWDQNTWVELTYAFDLSASEISSGDPLILTLSPSAYDHPTVGSILVAAPQLKLDI